MPESQSKFIWYDLMTSDLQAAESFYQTVLGWESKDSGLPGDHYTIFSVGPTMVSGLMLVPKGSGAGPSWMGYIGVDDVDAYTARVVAAGGSVYHAPQDIPGIGRFSVVADPQGAVFSLFHPLGRAETAPEPTGAPGLVCWHELCANDLEAAFEFYADLFGWTKAGSHDMGAMGSYQMFAAVGTAAVGGIMTTPPNMPTPFWLYYISVDAVQAAVARVTEAGGTVVHGPAQVPGGWIAQCLDPQGALFGIAAMQG
jgi:predicted enzyme related to lactoylglutathione lyase